MAITKITAQDGSNIFIQYDDIDDNINELQAISNNVDIEERTKNFKNGLETNIKNYALLVLNSIQNININSSQEKTKLKGVQLEFGIQIAGETGIPLIAKGSIQSNVIILLNWELK